MTKSKLSMRVEISGPAADVKRLFHDVEAGSLPELAVDSSPQRSSRVFDRTLQRQDPWVYGFVVFTAHLSASLAHDYIKALINKQFPSNRFEIRTPEEDTLELKTLEENKFETKTPEEDTKE